MQWILKFIATSDVDTVVEFSCPIGLCFIEFAEYLERVMRKKCDVLTPADSQDCAKAYTVHMIDFSQFSPNRLTMLMRFRNSMFPPVATFHKKFVAIDSPITYIDQGHLPFHAASEPGRYRLRVEILKRNTK